MAEEKTLGRLPKWPRKALNNSVIAAEQAYRKRSGLPVLTDADIEALKAGLQMSRESDGGGGASSALATSTASAPAAVATPTATAVATAGFSPEVEKWLAAGKKWSKSAIAAEQARRKRNNLTPLNEAEITALLGEPAGAASAAPVAAPSQAPAAPSRPAPAAKPALPNVPQIARTGT